MKKRVDVRLVTYKGLPELDPDDRPLGEELRRRGYSVEAAIWNDPQIDWSASRCCVIRSTWDYHFDRRGFINWAQSLNGKTLLLNPAEIIEWNSHKQYLVRLAEAGVPTIPTACVLVSRPELDRAFAAFRGQNFVVKPAVGLGTYGVKMFAAEALHEGREYARQALQFGDILLQPFMPSVHEYGERALVFIDGEFSHAVRKSPFQKLRVAGHAGETRVEATPEEIEIGKRALATLNGAPLYARVDLVRDLNDNPVVMELELVEPSLFLSMSNLAERRLATAVEKRLQQFEQNLAGQPNRFMRSVTH